MKIFYKTLVAIVLIASACSNNNSNQNNPSNTNSKEASSTNKELFVNKLTASIVDDKEERKEELLKINDEYFEINLEKQNQHYIAVKDIENIVSGSNIKHVSISIVDDSGQLIRFNNSTEFLNHISDRGYELVNQKNDNDKTHYTFKKK
jgi:thioredoxin-related protein